MLPAVWDLSEAVGGDRSSIGGRKMDSSPTRMSDETGRRTKECNGSATDSENNSEHSPEDHNTESIPGIDGPSRDNALASPECIDFYSNDLVESDLEETEDDEGDEDNDNERNAFRAQYFPRTSLLENTYPKTSLTYLNMSSQNPQE
ncbi:hypothetical protein N7465_006558 [Penicillium sp. CMV-2018d]|nr:hypothetical protein N7465_006558 [Penicillium sp. CMV-2018d]